MFGSQRRSLWSVVVYSIISNAASLILTWQVVKVAHGTYKVVVFCNKTRKKIVKVILPPVPFANLDAEWVKLPENEDENAS
jgi:hypothetical protein